MYFCYYLFQHPEGCRPLQDNEDIQVHESLEFKDKFRKHDAKAYLISINITGILTMNIKTGDNAKINCYTRVNAAILTTCRILLASPFYRAYRDFKCKRCLHCVIWLMSYYDTLLHTSFPPFYSIKAQQELLCRTI